MSVQPVRHVASLGAQGVALDAAARESLFLTLQGARIFHASPRLCARHAHGTADSMDARRLTYLSRQLELQGVQLARTRKFSCPSTTAPARGEIGIELEIGPCY